MGPPDSHRISRVPRYSGAVPIINLLRLWGFHPLWPDFPVRRAHRSIILLTVLQPPQRLNAAGLGSSPVARRYWGNHSYFLFLRLLRCFSSPRSPPLITRGYHIRGGLSHSETPDSTAICASTGIFAAYRVLLRLWEPRHPPYALIHFLDNSCSSAGDVSVRTSATLFSFKNTCLLFRLVLRLYKLYNFVQHVIERLRTLVLTWRITDSNR